jgi:excisionase family DNA binding protein
MSTNNQSRPLHLPTDQLLTSDDVCAFLNIRRLLLYQLLRRGEIESIRVGRQHRFLPSVIEAYVRRGANA